jgi:hypothetical protein
MMSSPTAFIRITDVLILREFLDYAADVSVTSDNPIP